MTTFTEAVEAADALIDQLQELTENPCYLPRFFDAIFGLRTALGNERDRFASLHSSEAVDRPAFAKILDRCEQATMIGAALAAFTNDGVTSARPALRGALRLRRSSTPLVRPGRRSDPTPEPYYTSLMKLFPVEAVTLYPLAIGIAGTDIVIRLILIAIITLFVIALRWFGTQEESGGDADVLAIGVSVISFELYAASLGGFGYLPGGPAQTSQFLAFITIMWVALVPFALRHSRR